MSERNQGWGYCWRCGARVHLWSHKCPTLDGQVWGQPSKLGSKIGDSFKGKV